VSGLLNHARKFLRGITPPAPVRSQGYAVLCPQGHRLTGARTEGYQILRCTSCGGAAFVLPRSPLPEPAAAPGKPAESTRPQSPAPQARLEAWAGDDGPAPVDVRPADALPRPAYGDGTGIPPLDEADGEVEWVDEVENDETGDKPSPAPPRPAPAPAVARPKPGPASFAQAPKPKPKSIRPAAPEPAPAAIALGPKLGLGDRLRARRNPLIFAGVAVLVMTTLTWRVWRSRIADLPRVVEVGRTDGIPALDAGKFDRAHQLLSRAKAALARLGDSYQGAGAVRQAADEAEVIVGLAPGSLESLLEEAARSDAEQWVAHFDTLYKGRTVILDAQVTATPDAQGKGRYELDYRIIPDGGGGGTPRTRGRVDLTGLKLIEMVRPKLGDGVRIGVRLASFRFDLDREEWLVGLEPDSGVIMTHGSALEALGWPKADAVDPENQP